MARVTVSKAHLAQRCPRLLAYLTAGRSEAWKVGLRGTGDMRGKKFHTHLAQPFFSDMAGNGQSKERAAFLAMLAEGAEGLHDRMARFLRDHYLVPYLSFNSKSLTEGETMAMALGVQRWATALADFLMPSLEVPRDDVDGFVRAVFHLPEQTLSGDHAFGDGRTLTITGRYDALLVDEATGEAVLIEFKGTQAGQLPEDFTQVALYAWLIERQTGICPRAQVIYLEEADPVATYSTDDIRAAIGHLPGLFDQIRDVLEGRRDLPKAPDERLCGMCLYKAECETDWQTPPQKAEAVRPAEPAEVVRAEEKPRPEGTPRVAPDGTVTPTEDDKQEARRLMAEVVEALRLLKLPVHEAGFVVGPRFVRLKVRPDLQHGVTVNKLTNKSADLQVALGLSSKPLIQPQQGFVGIDVPRKGSEPLTLGRLLEMGQATRPGSQAVLPLGAAIDGRVRWADLAEPTMTSMLVGGTSGSGKSVFLTGCVVGLGLSAPRDAVRFTLIDPKRVTFTGLAGLPCLDGSVLMDIEPAVRRLGELVDEMESRYRRFAEAGVPDILAYNQQADAPLFRRVILIDEYADMVVDKETRGRLEEVVQRIGQKGRAAGYHLILATQRPDAKVVTPIIKANLQLKIALKVTSASNSRIILDEGGAEYLIGHGDMLVGGSIPLERLQGPLVTKTEIDELGDKHS